MLRLQWDSDCEITESIESELLIQAKLALSQIIVMTIVFLPKYNHTIDFLACLTPFIFPFPPLFIFHVC